MIDASARPARSLKQAISRRLPKRRDDSGLTTLEWLLIVAAVAGLAALAVVLVQNVVRDTSEQIASNSARMTAATLEAADITEQATSAAIPGGGVAATPENAARTAAAKAANKKFGDRCTRMNIGYNAVFRAADPVVEAVWTGGKATATGTATGWDTAAGSNPLCEIE